MATIVIAKRTLPRHYIKIDGQLSKLTEYLQIEGAPLIVTAFKDDGITLNSLTSAKSRTFKVTKEELKAEFYPAQLDKDNYIINLKKYPKKVNISEFESRDILADFNSAIKKEVRNWDECLLRELLLEKHYINEYGEKKKTDGKLGQLSVTQGSGCDSTPKILAHIEKMRSGKVLTLKEKHYGEPLFNRSSRCNPVVDKMPVADFRACNSYPLPIGIRNKDFCVPSEMIAVSVEMIRQLLTLKNVEEKYRVQIQKIFTDFDIPPQFDNHVCHRCTYCGEEIDINSYSSNYASKTNYIEICHRDPNACFCTGNMYWGHGECNRRQGGYTETERCQDALGLINFNPLDYPIDLLKQIRDSCDAAIAVHSI
ncbi:MAG: hypothetical protein CXT73_03515 [Methanobacteriota archaeon]|nr:MAG: hypothetical protein CXT73_03515 [Euryarchaeota archaeon]